MKIEDWSQKTKKILRTKSLVKTKTKKQQAIHNTNYNIQLVGDTVNTAVNTD